MTKKAAFPVGTRLKPDRQRRDTIKQVRWSPDELAAVTATMTALGFTEFSAFVKTGAKTLAEAAGVPWPQTIDRGRIER